MDKELLSNFIEDAIITHKSSFVAVARLPADAQTFDRSKHLLLPRSSAIDNAENYHNPLSKVRLRHQQRHGGEYAENIANLAIDPSGNTVAHVMSITKAMMGLMWAYCIYNVGGHFPDLRKVLLDKANEQSKLGFYLSTEHINIPKIRNASVIKALTQTTGIVIGDTNAFSMLKTLIMSSRHEAGTYDLTSIESELVETLIDTSVKDNEFHYSDKMTQVTSMALEDMFKKLLGFEFLLADHIPQMFFPPEIREASNIKQWPIIFAGYYETYTKCSAISRTVTVTMPVYNSLGFWGVRMTGQQMLDYGAYLLIHFTDLLLHIYDDKDIYITLPPLGSKFIEEEAKSLGNNIHATRAGWRYNCFWWIPRFEDYPELNNKYKWISAIGFEGQFILLELTQRWVFIRQHFAFDSLLQNVDISNVSSKASDKIRYPAFCYDAFILVAKLNGDLK